MAKINYAWDDWDERAFGEDVEYTTPKISHNIRPCWNQWKNTETKSACTIVGAVNQIIRLFWIDLNMEKTNLLYKEVVKYCEKHWYIVGQWWSTPTACNIVCKRWNEIWYKTFNKEKVFRERLYWNNPKILEALNLGHMVWYTKNVNFASDQVEWLVRRDPSVYPKMVGHRLNWKWIEYTKATGWADITGAERGSQDNYHGQIGENFAFKQVKPYINNWVYAYWYVIMPESCMKENIENEKERIRVEKAVNCLLWVLSSTRWDLDEKNQKHSSEYANYLRSDYPGARELEKDQSKKVYQAVVDVLSYWWKFAWAEEQKKYSELASYLREKYNLK